VTLSITKCSKVVSDWPASPKIPVSYSAPYIPILGQGEKGTEKDTIGKRRGKGGEGGRRNFGPL